MTINENHELCLVIADKETDNKSYTELFVNFVKLP